MWKRIQQFFESVAFAGLRPSGGKRLDPLYLSNRTLLQKARIWLLIGVPSFLLLGGLGLVLSGYFNHDVPITPPPALSNAEIAQKMLPNLNQDLGIDSQRDLEIQDVHIVRGGSVSLAGSALNNSGHVIRQADIVFDLADKNGSRQGAVTTHLANLAAKSTVPFQFAIEQKAAAFALVREIHIR